MEHENFLRLGYKIKYERCKQGLSQMELSMRTGLTTRSLSRIECGTNDPKFSTLLKISSALKLDMKELFDYKL